jgi:hypothetical protein
MTEETLVSTKEIDYLDEDKPIRGQNYCLLSFLSPETTLVNKENYYFSKFTNKFGNDMKSLLDNLENKYPDSKELVETIRTNHSYLFDVKELDEQYKFFKSIHSEEIEKDFYRENNFQTSMRGIKVRGVFDTIDEAKNRCEFLKKLDNKFDIFIGQVGCWCPWSPNPNELENQEYSETQLNTLMKQYKKNMEDKDEVFEKRRQDVINKTKKGEDLAENLSEEDPWSKRKAEEPQPTSEEPQSTSEEPQSTSEEPQSTPEESQPTPQESQPIPEESQPTPQESQPTSEEPQPTSEEPQSISEEPESTPEESQPTPQESQSTPDEPQSTPQESQSTPYEPQSTPQESQSIPDEPQPTPEESKLISDEPQSTPEESQPTSEEPKSTS